MRGSISESVLMQSIFRRGICSAGLRAVAVVVLCLAAALWAGPAGATSLTWDKNGATAGQTDGTGVWLATDQWWDGAANATWTSGDDAIFGNGGTGGYVTLASPTTVNSLTMNSFDGTYTLGDYGQAITLNTGLTLNPVAGNTTIISPVTLGGPQSWLNNSVGKLTVSGALTNGANLLTVGGTGNTNISGGIGNGAGGITKLGEGTLFLGGSSTYTGDTTISNGMLLLYGGAFSTAARNYSIASGAVLNLYGSTDMANGTSTISGSGTLRITNGPWHNDLDGPKVVISLSPGGLIDVQAGGSVRNGGWQPFNWSGNFARLNVDGSFDMWNGNNVTVDALTGSGTVVEGGYGAPNLTVGIANGSGTFSGTISNALGTVSLTKTGAGTQTLSGSNSYTGMTSINAGALVLGKQTSLNGNIANLTPANVTVESGAVLGLAVGDSASGYFNSTAINSVLNGTHMGSSTATTGMKPGAQIGLDTTNAGGTFTHSGAIGDLSGGDNNSIGLAKLGEGTLTLSGANTYTGDTTISNGVLKLQGGAFSTAARNYSIASGAALNLDGTTTMANGTSTISGSGTLRITNGLWYNNFDGPKVVISLSPGGLIDVQAGGSVRNGGWQPFNWSGNSARLNVDGSFDMWNGNTVTVDALTGSGTVVNSFGGGINLTVGIANGSGTFSGTISKSAFDTIALTKTGAGTQTLSGSNSYNGATTVSNGKLLLGQGGSMGATAVSVTGTATYGMARTSSGASVQGGSTLSLGSGTTLNLQDGYTNTMSFTSTGVLSGAGLYFDLGTTTADCDILALTGAATVTGTNTFYFDVLGSSLATGDHAYMLITAASGLLTGGTFAIDTTLPEYTLTLDRLDTAVYLNVVLNVVLGDTNGDFVVDATDYIALKTNFGMTEGATLAQGNFDADIDGNVDWDDLQILMGAMSTRTIGEAPAAPEPATLGLLAIGALAVLRRRKA